MRNYHELRKQGLTAQEAYNKARLTREQWLVAASKMLEADKFTPKGYEIKSRYRVSCSLPSKAAFSKKLRRIGEAWHSSASKDGTCEVFISPTIADSRLVVSTLAHELVHVCVGNEAGHGPVFKKCALAIGLEGKMTATHAGDALNEYADHIVKELGRFPHAELDHSQRKKQSTRMLKVVCTNMLCQFVIEQEKPFTVRMSKSVFEVAAPKCGCCDSTMTIEVK